MPLNSIKSIKVRKQTAVLTFDLDSDYREENMRELKALIILYGAYNKLGRSIPISEFTKYKKEFEKLLEIVKHSLDPDERNLKEENQTFT